MTPNTELQGQASVEDLRQNVLNHYEKVAAAAHEWHSAVPKAISAYFDAHNERDQLLTSLAEKQEEIEKLKAALAQIRDAGCVMSSCASRYASHDSITGRFACDCPAGVANTALNPISEPQEHES